MYCFFLFKQKTAYEMRISDWSSDVCSSDLVCNLIDGWVALYTLLEDGRRQIVQLVLPGGVFGMFGTLSGRATYGAPAPTGALVCCIPLAARNQLVRHNLDLAVTLVRSFRPHRALALVPPPRVGPLPAPAALS